MEKDATGESRRMKQREICRTYFLAAASTSGGMSWKPPDPSWVQLNADGAFSHLSRAIECGGVIIDDRGAFVLEAFSSRLNDGDELVAELWARVIGMIVSWDHGYG